VTLAAFAFRKKNYLAGLPQVFLRKIAVDAPPDEHAEIFALQPETTKRRGRAWNPLGPGS